MNGHRFSSAVIIGLTVVLVMSLLSCSSDDKGTNNNGGSNPPPANAVNIASFAFSPANKTIKVGDKVTWTNNDNTAHTVTSDDDGFTSSGNLAQGAKYEFTFTVAGSYPYHCALHPAMTGTITVTP